MQRHHGACLCGAVRFEVEGAFEHFFLCHCSFCRKDTGSAHSANLFSAAGVLTWLAGAEQVKTFVLPGTRHARSFCANCSSALPRLEGSGCVVPAGSLESPLSKRPDAHLFLTSRADWDRELETIRGFDTFPGQ